MNLSKSGSNVAQALDTFNEYIDQNKEAITIKKRNKQYVLFIFLSSNDLRSIYQESQFNRHDYKKIINISRKVLENIRLLQIPPIPSGFHAERHVI